ncbi:hypothetical protein LJR175_003130 [Variovorax sp. LjRoot175]|uniref:hypothetical protein n=1 Tax=Variovorax sp. LjRoot175 TaxID=3342276 RepID=UPI003ED05230
MAASVAAYAKRGLSAVATINTSDDPKNTTTGQTFAVWIFYGNSTDPTSVTDNFGNTYVQKVKRPRGGPCAWLYVCENGTGGTGHYVTVNVGGGTEYPSIHFGAVNGVLAASYDLSNAVERTAQPWNIDTGVPGTLAQPDEIVFTFVGHDGDGGVDPFTETTGNFTALGQINDSSSFWISALAYRLVSSTANVASQWTNTSSSGNAALIIVAFKASAGGSIVEADATITAAVSAAMESAKLLGGVGAISADGTLAGDGAKILGGDLATSSGQLTGDFIATAVSSAVAAVSGGASTAFVSGSILSAVWAATADLQASFESNSIASSEADFSVEAAADVLFDGGAVGSAVGAIGAGADLEAISSAIVSSAFDMEAAADTDALGTLVLSAVATAVLELLLDGVGEAVQQPGTGGALTPAALLRVMRRPATNRTMNRPAGSRVMRRTG